jgi:putative hydrolase of HD superfamily
MDGFSSLNPLGKRWTAGYNGIKISEKVRSVEPKALLAILHQAEQLKCVTRHCDTSSGRRESVAEHSWRLALMAMLTGDAFPDLDIHKVIRMCLIHDLGESFTGDIPAFEKVPGHREREQAQLRAWFETFPEPSRTEFLSLQREMNEMETGEARLYKALDNLEAVIQHNESDISTWLPLEYDLQLVYGEDKVAFSPYLQELKAVIDTWTRRKIAEEGKK